MEVGDGQVGEVTCGRSPHLSCKRDQIKMRDYVDSGLPTKAGYLTYHLHENRPLDFSFIVLNILAD